MIPGLKAMGAAEVALRFMARRGHGDWTALVVGPGIDVASTATELADEMAAAGDCTVTRILDATTVEALAEHLAATPHPAVVSGLEAWPAAEWGHFNRLRSRFARSERTALVVGRAAFEHLAREAPNFGSWLGASVVAYLPDASVLSDDEREQRLQALREWSGRSDEEVLAQAAAGSLPPDPEFAEWLVLLRRGDLLGR